MPEQKPISEEDRKRTLLWNEAASLTLDIESMQEKIMEMGETIRDATDDLRLLQAKQAQLQAKAEEYSALFWRGARKQLRDWFQQTEQAGLTRTFERIKEEGGAVRVELIAYDPTSESLAKIRQIFMNRQGEGLS